MGVTRLLENYRDASFGARLFMRVRWMTCPFPAVERAVPKHGRVLDVGCGHGLLTCYLSIQSPVRRVRGIDPDREKIAVARQAAVRVSGSHPPEFRVGGTNDVPAGRWDAIVVVDVLYLLDEQAQRSFLATCIRRLAPGGRLIIKEMADRPRLKFWWNRLQETISVRLLGFTQGSGQFHFTPPQTLAAWLREAGLQVRQQSIDRRYLHPHYLTIGSKRRV